MKKIKICLISLLIISSLSSCFPHNDSTLNNSSSYASSIYTGEEVYNYYLSKQEELNKILKEKDNLNTSFFKTNAKVTNLYNSYWETYTETITYVQENLKNEDVKTYFVSKLGEEETTYLINIDTSKIFYNREITPINEEEVNLIYTTIEEKITNKDSFSSIVTSYSKYVSYFYPAYNNALLMRVSYDLYTDNEEYYSSYYTNVDIYTSIQDNSKKFFKSLLTNEFYKDTTINYFSFSESDINYYLNVDTSSDEEPTPLKELQNQEEELLKEYNVARYKEKVDYNELSEIYLDLVKVRRKIASLEGYDNYEEYRFNYYERDYSVSEAKELFKSVKNSSLHDTFSHASINSSLLRNNKIGDKALLDSLDYVTRIVPSSKNVIRDFKTYGRYNFDVRTNKYTGSYETPLSTASKDYFVLLNCDGYVTDYNSLFHEFGHYLASLLNEPSYKGNLSQNLDVAEMDSQSLELLIGDYYASFIDEDAAKELIKYSLFQKMWSILSSITVASFEDYVYTTEDELTLDSLQTKFNELCSTYISPRTFMKDGTNNVYSIINHIFISPCYYISYAVSAIPSLEINLISNRPLAFSTYNELLKYGETNAFKYVINKLNLDSPFELETIDKINTYLKEIFN